MKETVQSPSPSSSQKLQPSQSSASKKTRTPAAKATPKLKSRTSKREKKSDKEDIKVKHVSEEAVAVEEKEKAKINTDELKNELLADWLDDEDDKGADG